MSRQCINRGRCNLRALTESRERRCVGANYMSPAPACSSEGTPQGMLRPLLAGISALLPRGLPTFSFFTVPCHNPVRWLPALHRKLNREIPSTYHRLVDVGRQWDPPQSAEAHDVASWNVPYWLPGILVSGIAIPSDPIQKFAVFGVAVVNDRLHHVFRSDHGRGRRERRHRYRLGIKFSVPSRLSHHPSTLRSAFAQKLNSRDVLDGRLCLADFRGFRSKVSGLLIPLFTRCRVNT